MRFVYFWILVLITKYLSILLQKMCWQEEIVHVQPPMYPTRRLRLMLSAIKLFNQLYDRNCRKEFCHNTAFLFDCLPLTQFTTSAVGKYLFKNEKERAVAYMESTVVDISIPPPSFKSVSLALSRSPLL